MNYSVLLDTSFIIRFLNKDDKLHKNAYDYYQYFLEKNITLKISTISIAEYCVVGKIEELPLKEIQIVPFNFDHSKRTGEFSKIIFRYNKYAIEKFYPRAIIPNDSKLFSQADLDERIRYFVTSDERSLKTLEALKSGTTLNFEIISIRIPCSEFFSQKHHQNNLFPN